jgi:hypothetical protein
MVRETLISQKELYEDLAGNTDAKDALLRVNYSITDDQLLSVRHGTTFERALKAAILLRDSGFENQVNSTILPALMYREWDNPHQHKVNLNYALQDRHDIEKRIQKGEIILDYLKSCYSGQAGELNKQKGGAGRGLHQIVENSDLVVFNISPRMRTEVIALFQVDTKTNSEKTPSFHLFIK